jgi:GST-like protein
LTEGCEEHAVVNRYRREAERHYDVLETHLEGRAYLVGDCFTVADIAAWGWIARADRVLQRNADPLADYPNLKRWFASIEARPATVRARQVGKDHAFKREMDEETRRALFPSNYPKA